MPMVPLIENCSRATQSAVVRQNPADEGGALIKGKVGHGSKRCGNNTSRWLDKGVVWP